MIYLQALIPASAKVSRSTKGQLISSSCPLKLSNQGRKIALMGDWYELPGGGGHSLGSYQGFL